jgi:hypothetical protein
VWNIRHRNRGIFHFPIFEIGAKLHLRPPGLPLAGAGSLMPRFQLNGKEQIMGFSTGTWGSINPGQTIQTGVIWSPFNANMTGGADQGAQINLVSSEDAGVALVCNDQTKQKNEDGTIAYFVTVTYNSAGNNLPANFILQGGGF